MIRLHMVVEGQTEETFVNRVLVPEFARGDIFVDARKITTGRRHGRAFRGGHVNYEHLARDICLWMKQDQREESWFTVMVDLHRLPENFPGRLALSSNLPARERAERLEAELAEDLATRLNALPVARRFIPYIQLHEFEALLFSDPSAFLVAFPGQQTLVEELFRIRSQFDSPEEINDEAPPSKRIAQIMPGYEDEKAVAGPLMIQHIGLARIRCECRHFDRWVTRLLALAGG